ncbi:MAG: putative DNA binding domain-containing protein [bacterium]|nr:putative DNA binding domain-containing protein [Deltaproteobacteria bacterium]MDE0216613.1 putative DNA binding domain-containing protein [bacterium]
MTLGHLGGDPIERHVATALDRIAAGVPPADIEHAHLDLKEEPGRRDTRGSVVLGSMRNEEAAAYLAGEMACMANTPGGGAIVLGVADDGEVIGTELDTGWLRHRIWELTQRLLTVAIRPETINTRRLLVLTVPEALEPVRHGSRLRWRVGANCVEVDPVTWRAQSLQRLGYDWSAEPSQHTLADARPAAVDIARRYLRDRGTPAGRELADARDRDLLTRLELLDADGRLTNAGSLLFVETPFVGIDYMRRDRPGGDSLERIEGTGPLVEQVWEVERAGRAANRTIHIDQGFVHRQIRAIPERAFREAVVNGVTHRDWLVPQPTVVEHVGDTLAVVSPGGFIGGVSPDNAITHPAVPRYRRLAQALAALGLAERQGVGIDRMVTEMLGVGRPAPVLSQVDGPCVRVTLSGGAPDAAVVAFVSALEPPTAANVDTLLLLEQLSSQGWTDAASAAPLLQRHTDEAAQAIAGLLDVRVDDQPVIVEVKGVPADQTVACRLSDAARQRLAHRLARLSTPAGRDAMFVSWAIERGRVSSTEAADLADITPGYANQRLAALAHDGELMPARAKRRGRGFHYIPSAGQQ